VSASGGQTHFQHVWTPTEADVGKHEIAALVVTKLDPLIPLHEIGTDSRKQVDVKCFTGPTGAKPAIPAATCEDAWTGTATNRISTPGAPEYYIQTSGNLRWEQVESTGSPPFVSYQATGTLTLEMPPPPGCTMTIVPHVFNFPGTDPRDGSVLGISYVAEPVQYGFNLQAYVDFTTTVTCPDEEPTVTELDGFPLGLTGGATFMTPQDVTMSGSFDDGVVSGSWTFSRL
jgi:hypothetical protein